MSTKLISYDLIKPTQDYPNLIDKIKSLGNWCVLHRSTWLIDTTLTSEQLFDALRPYIDSNDQLFVCNIERKSSVWCGSPKAVDDWLMSRG